MRRSRARLILTAALFLLPLLAPSVGRAQIRLFSEFDYIMSSTETTDKTTGEVTKSEFSRFGQLYNLDISRQIFPNLTFRGGGIYELDMASTSIDGDESDFDDQTIRPFVSLDLATRLYGAGVGYIRTEEKRTGSDIPTTRDFRNEYTGVLWWRPVGYPQLSVNYTLAQRFNSPKTEDLLEEFITFNSRYSYQAFSANYTYTRIDTEDKITDFTTVSQSHNARLNYSHPLFRGRVIVSTGYRITYTTTGFSGAGAGTFPVLREEGLFSLDDFSPQDGALLSDDPDNVIIPQNLIDGDPGSSSNINIGLAGDETTLSSAGLELLAGTQVDTLRLWVSSEAEIRDAVEDFFLSSMQVFVSQDNQNWNQVLINNIEFQADDSRFVIEFNQVTTQFIKVVIQPLEFAATIGVPGDFTNIFITELEALITVSGQEGADFTSVDHNYNVGLSWRVTDRTTAGYTFFLRYNKSDPGGAERTVFTHTVNLNHIFNETFSLSAGGARSDRDSDGDSTTTHNYGSTLRADWLATFKQSLTFGGTITDQEEGTTTSNTVFLRSSADLYRGWSADLDLGLSWSEDVDGTNAIGYFARSRTELIPHRRVTLNLNYTVTGTKEENEDVLVRQNGGAQLFYLPFDTLSLFARVSFVVDQGGTRVFQNYSANWAPFPGGALQFFFRFNEVLTSEGQETTAYGPGVNWEVTRFAFLNASYTIIDDETDLQKRDVQNFAVALRITL